MPSPRKKLTDENVLALPIKRKRYIVYDTDISGLGVRVGKSRRTFVLVARFNGKTSRKSLGAVGRITVDVARQRARRMHNALEGEQDVHITFGEVLDKLVDSLSGKKYPDELDRVLRRDVPAWMNKPIVSITRKDVVAALDARKSKKSRRHGKTRTESAAHHLLSYARRVFNFAVDRDIIQHAPTDRLKSARLIGAKAIRTRVLTDDELRKVWFAADKLSDDFRDAVHLLILTGSRKGEVSLARRDEFKIFSRVWRLSADRTKQAAQHVVPLSKRALAIVACRIADTASEEDDDYLFGRPLKGWSKVKRRLDKAIGKMEHWTLHDLRRTFRTRLSSLRVPEHVAELAIGHSKKSLQRVYDQHQYASELREAFDAWDKALDLILSAEPEGSKLVPQPADTKRRSYPALAQDLPASSPRSSLNRAAQSVTES
jgi:intergrase/recombinase